MSKKKHKKKNKHKHNYNKKYVPKVTPAAEAASVDTKKADDAKKGKKGKGEKQSEKRPRRAWRILALGASAVIILAAILALAFVQHTVRPITIEVDSGYSAYEAHDKSPFAPLYTVERSTVNAEKVGTYRNYIKLCGFIECVQFVHIADTTAPVVTPNNVTAVQGEGVIAEDFILSCRDSSEVIFTFEGGEPDTTVVGEQTIAVTATDEYGNGTRVTAVMNVVPFHTSVETKTLCARVGDDIAPLMFIENISDPDMCTVSFINEPDANLVGTQDVAILIEDVFGNQLEIETKLFLCNIPSELSFEYGVTESEITEAVLAGTDVLDVTFDLSFAENLSEVGRHEVKAECSVGEYAVTVVVEDTVAPLLTMQEVTVFLGDAVAAEALVAACDELSEVSYTFEQRPDTSSEGSYAVVVVACDAQGNISRGETVIHVVRDTTPPEIFGVKNITITKGASVSFRNGVSAVDDRDGDVSVAVDSSAVNTNEVGTYPVYYSAADSSGNTAILTAYLTVSPISEETLNGLADNVLSYITTSEMTAREKAWAIYSWCTSNIRYSTRTSYLMGDFVDGAYSGFTTKSGNCYIYYAVASALLTRVGIENIEIQRDNPDSPHYWNLVKIDGEWYHFDTCPHYAGHALECFLLTDAQVRNYSEKEVAGYYSFDSSLYPATP